MKCLVSLTVVFFAATAASQDLDFESEFWKSLNDAEKVVFLQGVYRGLSESLHIMEQEVQRREVRDPYWTPPFIHERTALHVREYFSDTLGFDYQTMSNLLDVFYSNPDNIHIHITTALHILMLHQDGHVQRANEMLLIEQRKVLKDR